MSGVSPAVLDASALLAFLRDEPGADVVEQALARGAVMSAVNWAEVLAKLESLGLKAGAVAARLTEGGLVGSALLVWPLDDELAREIAGLRNETTGFALSMGQRACLALARSLQLPVLTADPRQGISAAGVEVRLIR